MIGQVEADGHFEYACAMRLGRFCGLRIHEVFRLDTATAERALRENALTVKGKGGKLRRVPIEHASVRSDLSAMLSRTRRGHKLFVPDGVPTDRAIDRLQAYLIKHRDALADADRDTNLTFHGLRHSYAAEKYKELTDNGMSALDARFVVSRLLGHERADVTDNYLSSVRRKGVRKNEGA